MVAAADQLQVQGCDDSRVVGAIIGVSVSFMFLLAIIAAIIIGILLCKYTKNTSSSTESLHTQLLETE